MMTRLCLDSVSKSNLASFVFATAVVFFIIPLISFASTAISADIVSDTVWTSENNPYVVESRIEIVLGVTLTINPGVIVKFTDGTALNVYGDVVANGTSENKIYFTSFEDDSIGGDTNGDGADSEPYPSWSLNFLAGSSPVFFSYKFYIF